MKYSRATVVIIGLFVIFSVFSLVWTQQKEKNLKPTGSVALNSGFTLTQVAQHSTQSSCWTTVNGSVYDLTAWISKHPGGEEAILSICGKDGSAAFNAQHVGQEKPRNELAAFLIGPLKK